jgi:hypothetical protein
VQRLAIRAICLAFALTTLHAQAPLQQTSPSATSQSDTGCCGSITPAGQHLLQVLDSMNVENLWLSHEKIEWETGLPRGGRGHTHCSAFAAAAGQRLGIYMLRPPQHSQDLLASAQGRWFGSEAGVRDGWRPVASPQEAQQRANQGELVVLVYINPEPHIPGHVAIVRPAIKSAQALERDGPQTIQAGLHNFSNGNAVRSFEHHKGAWPNEVKIFAHGTNFELTSSPGQ